MGSMFRLGASKLARSDLSQRLCKVAQNHNVVPVAFLTRKANLVGRFEKPAPYPYWKKKYGPWAQITDPMLDRFDENSRLIFVEGPPAAGKSEFAKQIAEEFNLFYMPSPSHDEYYINLYGFDFRDLNPELPDRSRFFDLKDFLTNPNHRKVAEYQIQFLFFRIEQYARAVLHILSTGQGVVLSNTVHADHAYMSAMFKAGYVSKHSYAVYKTFFNTVAPELLKPHLIVYLDVPVEDVKKNIKRRCIPHEVNSKVLTTEYLTNLEDNFKHRYLQDMSNHSQILVYDWRQKGDMEFVYQDIKAVDLDSCEAEGKLSDWFFPVQSDVRNMRIKYYTLTDYIYKAMYNMDDWPEELLVDTDTQIQLEELLERVPSEKYAPGFHPLFDKKFADHELDLFLRRSPRDSLDPEVQERIKKYILNPTE